MSQGTYAKLVPTQNTSQKIATMMQLLNIENSVSANDLHVTIVYSRKECNNISAHAIDLPIKGNGAQFGYFKNKDGTTCLVLHINSEDMHSLHQRCRDQGAEHDYDTFSPHITLSYDYDLRRPALGTNWLEYFSSMVFDQFIVEPLELNWEPENA